MSKILLQRIQKLCAEPIYLGATEAELRREIAENCWSISASDEERHQVAPQELAAAIGDLIEAWRGQISTEYEHGAIFYTWFDKQACQLRFCLISGIHSTLPFSCEIKLVPSALPIVESFLGSSEIIPISDLVDLSWNESLDVPFIAEPLKVYAVTLLR